MVHSIHKFAGIELGVSVNPIGISGMFYRSLTREVWIALSGYSDQLIRLAMIEIIKLKLEIQKMENR